MRILLGFISLLLLGSVQLGCSAPEPSDEIGLKATVDVDATIRAAEETEFAESKRQLAITMSKESTPEKVRNLLYQHHTEGWWPVGHAGIQDIIALLHYDPRVAALVEVATHGSPSEKQELLEALTEMCEVYLEQLPLRGSDPDAPWQPTARSPGGGKAYPLLLTYVDKDATTLALVTKMYLRRQKAMKEAHKARRGFDYDGWLSSINGMISAYACDHFLNIYETRLDLQEKLSARQLEVLKEYADHRKTRSKDWNEESDIMWFAVAFVQGESERSDDLPP